MRDLSHCPIETEFWRWEIGKRMACNFDARCGTGILRQTFLSSSSPNIKRCADVKRVPDFRNPVIVLVFLEACLGDHYVRCRGPAATGAILLHRDLSLINRMENGRKSGPSSFELIPATLSDWLSVSQQQNSIEPSARSPWQKPNWMLSLFNCNNKPWIYLIVICRHRSHSTAPHRLRANCCMHQIMSCMNVEFLRVHLRTKCCWSPRMASRMRRSYASGM